MEGKMLIYYKFPQGYGNSVMNYEGGNAIGTENLDRMRELIAKQVKDNRGLDVDPNDIIIANIMFLGRIGGVLSESVENLTAKLQASENEKATMTDRMLKIVNLCNRTKNNTSSWNAASAELAEKILRVAKGEPETDSKKLKIPH